MIFQAREGEISWLPGIAPSDLPTSLPSAIRIHLRAGEVGLESQGLVGAIPLRSGGTLQIIPKIGAINFLYLLFKAEGVQRDLEKEYKEFVSYYLDDKNNFNQIAARHLFFSASDILARSPKQGRVWMKRQGAFAVGAIEAVATAINLSCRKSDPVVCFIKEKTVDIPENRVITEALIRAWEIIEDRERTPFRSVFERWFKRFPRSRDLRNDLEFIERNFAAGRYGGARGYYRKPLMLSQIVLGGYGVGFQESEVVEGDAVLLNAADIFEKYVRAIILSAYGEAGYVVTKGGVCVRSLYTDGSFELEPDIVISRGGKILLIGDAKYKMPSSGDHYQMNTYLAVNGIKRGILISPKFEGNEIVVKKYATAEKVVVWEVFVPMGNLQATEEFLGSVVEQFA